MPKVATKPEPQLEAPASVDPLDILLTNSVPPVPEAPTETPPAPAPGAPTREPLFEPATEDEDEDEEDEAEAGPQGMAPDLTVILNNFLLMMDEREARLKTFVEEKLAQVRMPETNGTAYTVPTELAVTAGQYPSSMQHLAPQPEAARHTAAPQRDRLVAFIPKEDAYNPKHTMFVTWINGREIRGTRGQVMILSAGHAMDLARNGHGNCVDIAAMQGIGNMEPIPVQQNPDYSRPNTWDGLPTDQQSSIPVTRIG